jgi:hypothetical protein
MPKNDEVVSKMQPAAELFVAHLLDLWLGCKSDFGSRSMSRRDARELDIHWLVR